MTERHDRHDRTQGHEALDEAEGRFRSLVESSADGIGVYRLDSTVAYVNPAAVRMFGVESAEDLIGGSFWDYIAPESREAVERRVKEASISKRPQPPFREMLLNAAGEHWPAEVSSIPMMFEGEPAILATLRDLTSREADAQKVADSERLLRRVLDTTSDLVYIFDLTENRNVYANREIMEYLGYTARQILDLGPELLGTIVHPDDLAEVAAHHAGMVDAADGEMRDIEYRMRHANGEWRWLLSRDVPFARDAVGRVTQIVGSAQDTTQHRLAEETLAANERQLAQYRDHLEALVAERTAELQASNEALEEASRAKSFFLASMSHELRTPLNSVIGFSGVMLQGLTGELSAEQRTQLAMINRAGKQLLGLVNDVLDLERLQTGHAQVELETFDPVRLLKTITESARPMAEDVGLELELDVVAAPARVRSDRRKVEQVVLNFLSNAIKYTGEGRVTIGASRWAGGECALWVRDTGPGIAVEDRERIFEEFSQLLPQRGAKHPGTGLGLAISGQLAELLGGRIELESEVGEGSTFTLVLPAG